MNDVLTILLQHAESSLPTDLMSSHSVNTEAAIDRGKQNKIWGAIDKDICVGMLGTKNFRILFGGQF